MLPIATSDGHLDESEKARLLALARETLVAAFTPTPDAPFLSWQTREQELPKAFLEPSPCFVSLTSHGSRLRGCIGCTVTELKLYENIHFLTRQAAFHDPRFRPVQRDEIDALGLTITVLGSPRPLPSLSALKLGLHGLIVQHGKQRAVLLADVAVTYHWTPEEFLKQVCLKAGLAPEKAADYEVSYFEEVAFRERLGRKPSP